MSTPPYDPQYGSSDQPQPYPQAPQYPQAPAYPQQPAYPPPGQAPQYTPAPYPGSGYPPAPSGSDPGKGLGVVGLILSFLGCLSLVGLILSIVARRKSKRAGYSNGIALAGIIIGTIVLIASIIGAVMIGLVLQKCSELGPGVHEINGVTYTCS